MSTASTSNNTKGWIPPDLLPVGTIVYTSYKGSTWSTQWRSSSNHPNGLVLGTDDEPISLSGWSGERRKTITPTSTPPNGKEVCYIIQDGITTKISKLCELYSAPAEPPAAAAAVAAESVSLVVEEVPACSCQCSQRLLAADAEILKLKAALKCFI
jgi:hypothetical protein